ncbi:hypothetical protein Scep_006647 [Stephania cephalantha]|uniref:Uncharacterized protein n=1 Tax=Stephania cephalantha TaxID=152367 RepID=A0AAP0K9K7_9MAGN
MKLVWCPDIASKAFIDTVKSLSSTAGGTSHHHHHHHHDGGGDDHEETSVAELISAMAGGWNAKLIVETWSNDAGGGVATSVGLAAARGHTGGRHVCVVASERAGAEYREAGGAAAEVVAGEAEEAMGAVEGVDFLVVDSRGKDAERLMRAARTAYLPVGLGVEIAYVGASGGGPAKSTGGGRWFRHVDEAGEEHVFRR